MVAILDVVKSALYVKGEIIAMKFQRRWRHSQAWSLAWDGREPFLETFKRRKLITASLVVGALFLAGCVSSAQLTQLRADPMFSASPGAPVTETRSESAGGSTFGKDEPAHVTRQLIIAGDAAVAVADLGEQAVAAGWEARTELNLESPPVAALYQRSVNGGFMELAITWDGSDVIVVSMSSRP